MITRHLFAFGTIAAIVLPLQIGCRTAATKARPGTTPLTIVGPAPRPTSPVALPVVELEVGQASFEEELETRDEELAARTEELPTPVAIAFDQPEFTLLDAIRGALDASPDLVATTQQLAAADAALLRARAEFYPKLGVSEQYGVSNNPVTAFMFQLNQRRLNATQDFNNPATTDDFHTQLRLQQNVYSGERRLHKMHAANADSAAAAMNLAALQNQLVFRVAEAYYRLLQARDLVEVRGEAVTQVEQHLKIVESRFRNDTAVKSDVLTVEVRLAEVREASISARNQLQLAWAVLENVSGTRLETRELPDAIPAAPWSDHVDELEAAIAAATGQRAELGALANQRQAAAEGILIAQADKRLAVDVFADYDVFTGDFQTAGDGFFAGVIIQLNLFDGGRTRADVARAAARVRELQAREQRLMMDIELDVRTAYVQLQDAEARLAVAAEAIGQGRESLREIEVRYRGQTASITQLIDAQVALSNVHVRRTSAKAEVEIARVALQRAMGRLDELVAQ